MYNDPGYTRVGAAPRLFALSLLVIVLAVGGALWFDFLGLIDVTDIFAPALRLVGLEPGTRDVRPDDPLLLENERLGKREEALAILGDELREFELSLDRRERELQAREDQLAEREIALVDRENSVIEALRQVENKRAALVRLSNYLTGMPPAAAVEILVNYPDPLLLDVLLMTDELAEQRGQVSLVAFWLSRMPADRAAAIGEKLELLPERVGAD
ncbi:MAG: flagellar protein FlbB [Spirochaetaceae bacterium]|nr:MAG: flagellar protein FlbB [Spirochaetaceae bacterium]